MIMSRITIKEYRASKGGDYDCYKLSNGQKYWLWLKAPFRGGDAALVHIVTDDDKEVGTVFLEKNISSVRMGFEGTGKLIEVPITVMQDVRPNKKYYFDKIVRNLLIKEMNH
jgi:hypothetical protein